MVSGRKNPPAKCKVEGCNRQATKMGLCNSCYTNAYKKIRPYKKAEEKVTKAQRAAAMDESLDDIVDEKKLRDIWKIMGNKRGKKLTEADIKKVKKLTLEVLDACPMLVFKETIYNLLRINRKMMEARFFIDEEFKKEFHYKIAINKALETLRILKRLRMSSKETALIIRLRLVCETARNLLSDKYVTEEKEKEKENMTQHEKHQKVKYLLSTIGTDISNLISKDTSDPQSDKA